MTTADGKTLLDDFLRHEAVRRHRVYLTQPLADGTVVEYTWGEVGDQARRMATHLRSRFEPGSRIALLGRNSAHWIIADLAILIAGMVSVPLYATINGETARYVLEHCEAKLLILGKLDGTVDGWPSVQPLLPADLPLIGLPLGPLPGIPQWNDLIRLHEPLREIHRPKPEDMFTIMYTSGSTGNPKGVMQSYRGAQETIESFDRLIGMRSDDRLLSYLPLAHLAERGLIEVGSIHSGCQVFFADKLATFTTDIQRARPTVFLAVPRLWSKFYQAVGDKLPLRKQRVLFALPLVGRLVKRKILKQLGLDQARLAFTGAAPVPPALVRWYRKLGLEMLDVYGMTENFGLSHVATPKAYKIGTVGRAHPGVKVRIAANGEIEMLTRGLMLGYYKAPEQSREAVTADGYLRTGDCGEIDAEGFLRITGRVKDAFKTAKGKYVSPGEIENKLFGSSLIDAVCVVGSEQPSPFALLQLSPDTRQALSNGTLAKAQIDTELAALREHVNTELAKHEQLQFLLVTRDIWSVDNALLTPTLKVRRHAVEQYYLPRTETWAALGQPVVWEH
jgi:long-chain acyl-CoA synthetase